VEPKRSEPECTTERPHDKSNYARGLLGEAGVFSLKNAFALLIMKSANDWNEHT